MATNKLELLEPTKYMAIILWLWRPGEKMGGWWWVSGLWTLAAYQLNWTCLPVWGSCDTDCRRPEQQIHVLERTHKIPQHPANGMCLCVCTYNIYVCFFLNGNQESSAKKFQEQVNLCICHDLVASSIVKEHDNKLWWYSWWWWILVLAISKRYALCYAPPPPPPPPCHHFFGGCHFVS